MLAHKDYGRMKELTDRKAGLRLQIINAEQSLEQIARNDPAILETIKRLFKREITNNLRTYKTKLRYVERQLEKLNGESS